MSSGWRELIFGPEPEKAGMVASAVPRRTFADVILPPSTRRQLDQALIQIRKHDVIFGEWGLGERHDSGLALAFNFAGPPGTGKTICAEAIAHALGKPLMTVRYSELESQWAGVTAKNVSAVFRAAEQQEAVLFFDEADAVASRRFSQPEQGYQREANSVVNVLLHEVEEFNGVIIFATNLAANFDPAFERRIRTHILFEMPGPEEREKIWRTQLHARKTPLGDDVDFRALAERYPASGGDIKNAVLKAAQAAIAEPGDEAGKRIEQRHFEQGIEDVLRARRVMDQTLFGGSAGGEALAPWAQLGAPAAGDDLRDDLSTLAARLVEVEDSLVGLEPALRELQAGMKRQAELRRAELRLLVGMSGLALLMALVAVVLVLLR